MVMSQTINKDFWRIVVIQQTQNQVNFDKREDYVMHF